MKLQPASRKEITRITIGTLVCDGILIAALFLLSLVGVGQFDAVRILLGVACGSLLAVLNFTILCLTVQSAVGMENKRKMKRPFLPDRPCARNFSHRIHKLALNLDSKLDII